MKLHKEGYKTLRNEIIIFAILNYLSYIFIHDYLAYFITTITTFLFIMSVYFFRVPKRNFEKKEGVIYAPCDGKVVVIEETTENEFYSK